MQANSGPLPTAKTIQSGEFVFRLGEEGDCAYVIDSGEVEIIVDIDGEQRVASKLGPGKLFGEMAIIDRRVRMASAKAVTRCELTVITIEQLSTRLDLLDPVLRLCLDTITGRLRKSMQARLSDEVPIHPIDAHVDDIPDEINSLGFDGQHQSTYQHSDTNDTERLVGAGPLTEVNLQSAASLQFAEVSAVEATNVSATSAVNRIRRENELRVAIDNDQLCLYLQPILDLPKNEIVGFESLIRWKHPRHGLIGPDEFIPIAESSGLICGITDWVLKEACKARAELAKHTKDKPDMPCMEGAFISVNLSAQDITSPGLADRVMRYIKAYGLDPRCMKLEITESLLMSAPELAAASLGECRARGFQVAIDDFGTGFASFGYLQEFAVDGLKIDRRFVSHLDTADKDRAIVGSMINLATSLGIPVIAEGIEDQLQADVLSELGCGFVQGFLYARPIPWQDLVSDASNPPKRRSYDQENLDADVSEILENSSKDDFVVTEGSSKPIVTNN